MHFYSWKKGLKTGMYYLRTKSAADAIKFTIEKETEKAVVGIRKEDALSEITCSIDNKDDCEACGS